MSGCSDLTESYEDDVYYQTYYRDFVPGITYGTRFKVRIVNKSDINYKKVVVVQYRDGVENCTLRGQADIDSSKSTLINLKSSGGACYKASELNIIDRIFKGKYLSVFLYDK